MNASLSESSPSAAQSSEEALIATRRAKAEAARSQGINPFPNDLETDARVWLGPLRERFASALVDATEQRYDPVRFAALMGPEPAEVQVLGRVIARRGF